VDSLEQYAADLQASGIALELICGWDASNEFRFGVRLRAFAKNLPKNRMVIATGDTFLEATAEAIAKAESGRWENVDYAARPWPTRTGVVGRHTFGL
jgi:hypothetical protein